MRLTLALAFSLALPTSAQAANWYVEASSVASNPDGSNWWNAFPSVQDAVDAAVATDPMGSHTIYIGPGGYGDTDIDDLDVTLVGQSAAFYGDVTATGTAKVTLRHIDFYGGRLKAMRGAHVNYQSGLMDGGSTYSGVIVTDATFDHEFSEGSLTIENYDIGIDCTRCDGAVVGVEVVADKTGVRLRDADFVLARSTVEGATIGLLTYDGDRSLARRNELIGGRYGVRVRGTSRITSNVVHGNAFLAESGAWVVHNTLFGDALCHSSANLTFSNNAVDGSYDGVLGNGCPGVVIEGTVLTGTLDTSYSGLAVLNAENTPLGIDPTTYRPLGGSALLGFGQATGAPNIRRDFYGAVRPTGGGATAGAVEKR